MFDCDLMIVVYDIGCGELRGKLCKLEWVKCGGDCVDCYCCVMICLMGIDICNGL